MTLHKFAPQDADDDDYSCIDVRRQGRAEFPSLVQHQPGDHRTAAL